MWNVPRNSQKHLISWGFSCTLWALSPSLWTLSICLPLPSLSLTSRLVKTLLYNFIRQEKCPPPSTHVFEPKDEGGLLYGLASGVASKSPLTP